ncbi:hypothetical protein S1OALGB6SA_2164 [Olavius algarvensis spirochete endosymbiont]|nr:hypothetical protein S1OALGB6SA_2164 [Olavius algarvensis spirochete endosymbiont]
MATDSKPNYISDQTPIQKKIHLICPFSKSNHPDIFVKLLLNHYPIQQKTMINRCRIA